MQDTAQLHQMIQWLAGTDIGLLELRSPGGSIRLGRAGTSHEIVPLESDTAAPPAATIVAAPSVGVFLHAHPMQATPLAGVDAQVSAGQPLGLLQIGPLLQPVDAPMAGWVAGVRAGSGQVVGWGEPLVELHAIDE
jgi:acetyl-CoA carboxylase biotin carboxyl carrier protein